jgi:hypothetical protein
MQTHGETEVHEPLQLAVHAQLACVARGQHAMVHQLRWPISRFCDAALGHGHQHYGCTCAVRAVHKICMPQRHFQHSRHPRVCLEATKDYHQCTLPLECFVVHIHMPRGAVDATTAASKPIHAHVPHAAVGGRGRGVQDIRCADRPTPPETQPTTQGDMASCVGGWEADGAMSWCMHRPRPGLVPHPSPTAVQRAGHGPSASPPCLPSEHPAS